MENAKFNPSGKNYHFQDLSFVENLQNTFNIKETERIQENFIWKHSCPKIQHKTLRMDYKIADSRMFIFSSKLQAYSRLKSHR